MNVCRCGIVEFTGDHIIRNLGRCWDLGPVVVTKEPGSNILSIYVSQETLEHSLISLSEFKYALIAEGDLPLTVKFSVNVDRGLYDLGNIEFDDQAVCRYLETRFTSGKVELKFELVAKGKELCIFNEISDSTERTEYQKPLFWASILKRDIH
jgi:hypothetical protein